MLGDQGVTRGDAEAGIGKCEAEQRCRLVPGSEALYETSSIFLPARAPTWHQGDSAVAHPWASDRSQSAARQFDPLVKQR